VAQGLRLVLEAGVGGVVDVQARHLVEADRTVHRTARQVGLDPGGELLVALVVEQRLDRSDQDFEAFRNLALPEHGLDTNGMPTALALQGDSHEIALQATEGEVLVEHECQLHQWISSVSSRASSWVATRCGFSRVKHNGRSRSRSNRRRSSAVGL